MAKRRHPNKSLSWAKTHYFKHADKQHWVFAASEKKRKIELPRFDATKIIRHNKIKSNSNPYDKEWDDYFKERARKRLIKRRNIGKLANAN